MMLTTLILMTMIMVTLISLTSQAISKKMTLDRVKSSPFECGFDPKSSPRTPLSI